MGPCVMLSRLQECWWSDTMAAAEAYYIVANGRNYSAVETAYNTLNARDIGNAVKLKRKV